MSTVCQLNQILRLTSPVLSCLASPRLHASAPTPPQVYSTPKFKEMVRACISQDLSWAQPAKKWEAVLEEVVKGCTAAPAKKASVPTPVQAKQAALSR